MNYWELAAWIAAAVCLALAARYRYLYLDGQEQIRIYDQVISRVDVCFSRMKLQLLWHPGAKQWEVRGPDFQKIAADENWTVAIQNAVNIEQRRLMDTQPIPPAA